MHQETEDPWPVRAAGTTGTAPTILITSGASCPDATVDRVMHFVLSRYAGLHNVEDVLIKFEQRLADQAAQ